MAAIDLVKVDFILHCDILIDAAPGTVWPLLWRVGSGAVSPALVPAGGPRGQVGERFDAFVASDPDHPVYHVETVELEPARRRTVRFEGTDGGLIGYGSWTLSAQEGGTALSYDAFSRCDFPRDIAIGEAIVDTQRSMGDALAGLKALAEAH